MRKLLITLCCATLWSGPTSASPGQSATETLDAFHAAAARADLDTYLGLLTAEAVFLGTDGTERWQGEEFRQFVSSDFSGGEGWTYTAQERRVTLSADGRIAWFDETLDHDQLGRCRGSGVLLLENGTWRIAQYNLSVPIPNHMLRSVVAGIRSLEQGSVASRDSSASAAGNTPAVETVLEDSAGYAEDPATEEAEQPTQTRCRKRHKTNARADC